VPHAPLAPSLSSSSSLRDEAVALTEQLEALTENVDTARFAASWDELRRRLPGALRCAEHAIEHDVDVTARLLVATSTVALRSRQARRFEALLERCHHRLPAGDARRQQLRLQMAVGSIVRGDFLVARRHLLLGDDRPDGRHAQLMCAHVALRTGCLDEAAQHLQQLVRVDDQAFQLRRRLQQGLLLVAQQRDAEAVCHLQALLSDALDDERLLTAGSAAFVLAEAAVVACRWTDVVTATRRAREMLHPLGEQVLHQMLDVFDAEAHVAADDVPNGIRLAKSAFAAAETWGVAETALRAACLAARAHHADGNVDGFSSWVERVRIWTPVCAMPAAVEAARAVLHLDVVPTVTVGDDAAWFASRGQRVSLQRRPTLRRVLRALHAASGQVLDVDEVFAAGWPGVNVPFASRRKRVYTAVWQLRRMGLGDALHTTEEGYALSSTA